MKQIFREAPEAVFGRQAARIEDTQNGRERRSRIAGLHPLVNALITAAHFRIKYHCPPRLVSRHAYAATNSQQLAACQESSISRIRTPAATRRREPDVASYVEGPQAIGREPDTRAYT